MIKPAVALFAAAMAVFAASAAEVGVRQLRQDEYEFVLINATPLSEQQAMSAVAQVAAAVCKDLKPVLGKYRFESQQAIERKENSGPPDSFRFTQEVACVPGSTEASHAPRPALLTPAEAQSIQDDVRLRTEAYFRLIVDGRVDEAVDQMSDAAIGEDEAAWKRGTLAFRETAGEPVRISIVKVTVYDNPPEAPEPGLYVAADFNNAFENVPVHCGYLMWFRPIGGEFRVSRTEIGVITTEQLKSIPAAQLPELKRQLRCVEPAP